MRDMGMPINLSKRCEQRLWGDAGMTVSMGKLCGLK